MLLRNPPVLILVIIIVIPIVIFAEEPCMNCPTINKEVDISYLLKWQQIPDNINQGQIKTLIIKSKLEKFTWTVGGTGFWFDSQHTKKTIENTGAKSVSLFAGSNACGTATITVRGITDNTDNTYSISGDVKGNAGRWSVDIMVDEINEKDVCPELPGGCFWGWENIDVCIGQSNRYKYQVSYCYYNTSIGCEAPGCNQDPMPACSSKGACLLPVSDGICSYTLSAWGSYCRGNGAAQLYRSEWVCN
jgi:hypothetical protein